MATGSHALDTFPPTETGAGDVTAQPAVAPGQVSSFIAWFDHVSREDLARVGGKGANLGELTAAGLPVPSGFVITADAYLDALDLAGERDELQRRVEGLDVDDADALGAAAEDCREIVRRAGVPDAVREAIVGAYTELDREATSPVRVAVRSSATAEDTASTSFAGMNESFTNVSGVDDVVDRVVACWASLWSPRVVAYRATQRLGDEPAIAVVV